MTAFDKAANILGARAGLRVDGALRDRLSRCLDELAAVHETTPQGYVEQLASEPAMLQALVGAMTVQESYFFRDPQQLAALAADLVPAISGRISIWSAGCSRGQEPYSLAMLLMEQGRPDSRIIASDVSAEALARASAATYAESELRGLSDERRARWLVKEGSRYIIADDVRRMVTFRQHNLATDEPPFARETCQVIFCRNVLIYFRDDHLRRAIDQMYTWLPEQGHLFLGFSETLWQVSELFELRRVADSFLYRKPPRTSTAVLAAASALAAPMARRRPPATRALPAIPARPLPPGQLQAGAREMADGAHFMAGGDVDAAVTCFRRAAYLESENPVAHFHLALALEARGETRAARRALQTTRTVLRGMDASDVPSELEGYGLGALAQLVDVKLSGGDAP